MNKLFLFFICLFISASSSCAQHLSTIENKILYKKEDSLAIFAHQILNGRNVEDRFTADSQFTRTLVRALQVKNSFYYPFDSLLRIARVVPHDSTYKIFTWQLQINGDMIRQHGAIQMNTPDGSLKLFP